MYADDAMIFVAPIKEDVQTLRDLFQIFGDITCFFKNIAKSDAIPICCQALDLDDILLNFLATWKYMSCTYLGLPLSFRKLRRVQLTPDR